MCNCILKKSSDKEPAVNISPSRGAIEACIINKKYIIICGLIISLFILSCKQSIPQSDTPRYIITSPEVAEIIYALQGAENVVGVADQIDYPPGFTLLPKVGGFGGVAIERIIELTPSLVFTSGLEQEKLSDDLNKMGIKTMTVYPQSIDEMMMAIEEIAAIIGIPERGKFVKDSLRNELQRVKFTGDLSEIKRPKVYFEIYGNPIMSVSDKSFIGEVIAVAGGDNIFAELPREYSRIRQEEVINANPDVIILTYPGVTAEDIRQRKGWQQINACIEGRIYTVDDVNPDLILRSGPRVVRGVELLREIFYGE